MRLTEIRELSSEDLTSKVKELKQELFTIKFQQASGQQADGLKKHNIRKDIAKILTVLKERQLQNK